MNGDGVTGFVPLSKLRECPLNPRKTFPEDSLRELAASMTAQGVLQPLVVRPVPAAAKYAKEKWDGVEYFEVIAGHRRLKAARLAKLDGLPVLVRRLDDREALAAMVVENAQREDVPPSEEAAALRDLVEALGLEGAAEAVGKPLSAVRERAALAGLPAWFLAAVDAGLVPVSTAAVVARVPGGESRETAAVCVAAGLHDPHTLGDDWRAFWLDETGEGGPRLNCDYTLVLTQRDAKDLVRTHFCRELKGAPFSRRQLDLIPDAGSCDACPKRAGNDEDLKAEGVRADTCTDPECYAAKVAAYKRVEILKAESKHGALDADLGVSGFERPPRGWCRLDAPLNQTELLGEYAVGSKNKDAALATPMGKLLGDDCPQRYYAFARGEKLVLLVKSADARKVLQAVGVLKKPGRRPAEKGEKAPPKPSAKAPAVSDWEAKRQVGVETSRLVARTLCEYGTDNFEDLDPLAACGGPETNAAYEALVLVARTVAVDWCAMGSEREAAVLALLGLGEVTGDKRWAAVADKLKGLTPRQVLGFLVGACGAAAVGETYSGFGKLTDDLLAFAELDRDALAEQAARIVAGEESADAKVDAALAVQAAEALPPGPVVCAPVGAGRLKDVPGLTAQDVACLAAVGLTTLADLGRECGGDLDKIEETLERWPGAFRPADVERIARAVRRHLDANPDPEVRTSAPPAPSMTGPLTAAAYNARVAELKAGSPDWWRDEKAMGELAALWGDGCNAFGVLDAKEETVARAGKAVAKVMVATGACGLWLSSYSAEAPGSGSSGSPSVTDTAYDTREAAREAAIRKALAWCDGHRASGCVEKTKALTAKLADQLRAMLGEPKAAKKGKKTAA